MYCETVSSDGLPSDPYRFKVAYDKLVIAAGAEPLTFNIKGVTEHAIFLREVYHAQEIRRKLLLNLMLSENPGMCSCLIALLLFYSWNSGERNFVGLINHVNRSVVSHLNNILIEMLHEETPDIFGC